MVRQLAVDSEQETTFSAAPVYIFAKRATTKCAAMRRKLATGFLGLSEGAPNKPSAIPAQLMKMPV
jgi:hypothetical protein